MIENVRPSGLSVSHKMKIVSAHAAVVAVLLVLVSSPAWAEEPSGGSAEPRGETAAAENVEFSGVVWQHSPAEGSKRGSPDSNKGNGGVGKAALRMDRRSRRARPSLVRLRGAGTPKQNPTRLK